MIKLIKSQQVAALANQTSLARFFGHSASQFQQTAAPENKSNLYKLRKSTGFALSKCREAIEKFNGNIDEAAKWLEENAQKEGWAKSEKLKDRNTPQGTLVLFADKTKRQTTMIELNCETDFVAKNEKFVELSSQLAISVMQHAKPTHSKHILKSDELYKLGFLNETSRTIGDQLALAIGSLGENMSLKRAVIYNLEPNQHLSWYMHGSYTEPKNNCHFGRFGSMVNFSLTKPNENYGSFDLGRQIAQHIVGMKPQSIGEIDPASSEKKAEETPKIDENETRLIYQEFLMKPNTRVLDFLNENNLVINDFTRFECGETF